MMYFAVSVPIRGFASLPVVKCTCAQIIDTKVLIISEQEIKPNKIGYHLPL